MDNQKEMLKQLLSQGEAAVRGYERDFVISLAILGLCVCAIVGLALYPSQLVLVQVLVIIATAFYGLHQIKDMIMILANRKKVILTMNAAREAILNGQSIGREEE